MRAHVLKLHEHGPEGPGAVPWKRVQPEAGVSAVHLM